MTGLTGQHRHDFECFDLIGSHQTKELSASPFLRRERERERERERANVDKRRTNEHQKQQGSVQRRCIVWQDHQMGHGWLVFAK